MLNTYYAQSLSRTIIEALEEAGFNDPEEIIPGLVQAIVELGNGEEGLLEQAGNLLADGGVEGEDIAPYVEPDYFGD